MKVHIKGKLYLVSRIYGKIKFSRITSNTSTFTRLIVLTEVGLTVKETGSKCRPDTCHCLTTDMFIDNTSVKNIFFKKRCEFNDFLTSHEC